MFSLREIVFSVILLSLTFTQEEKAENNKNVSFRKYANFYGNFPYHNYEEISNNIPPFVYKLVASDYEDYQELLHLFYFLFFFRFAHDAFSSGDTKNGIYFITLPLLNILSTIVPQYVWIIFNLEQIKIFFKPKILLKLNFETGFYKLKNTKRKFIKNKCDNISSEIPEDICSICRSPFKEVEGVENNNGKNNIIKLECTHYFHNDCIDWWIEEKCKQKEKPTCPLCKKEIRTIDSNCIDFGIIDNDTMKFLAESVHFFSTCIYADLVLCVDNVSDEQFYWFLGIVLFRLGTQAVWRGDSKWELKPFIGFCGIILSFFEFINISITPMLYLVGWEEETKNKKTIDICIEFTFFRKFFE